LELGVGRVHPATGNGEGCGELQAATAIADRQSP
jgi:hypothetical protein